MTKVQHGLEQLSAVRPFPAAVTQLLAACQNPNSTAATYEKIIEIDPGLSLRLLRMANSPLYGLAKEVRSVGHAASLLGVRKLRSLALSVAGMKMFTEGGSGMRDQRDALWSHSIACAALSRIITDHCRIELDDQAFLAGIFHDVGMLFLCDVVPDAYGRLIASCNDAELPEGEKYLFGVTHEDIGMRSANGWGLSEEVRIAIGYHHRPDEALNHGALVRLVYVADTLDNLWGISAQCKPDAPVDLPAAVLDYLGLDEQGLVLLEEASQVAYREVRRVLGS